QAPDRVLFTAGGCLADLLLQRFIGRLVCLLHHDGRGRGRLSRTRRARGGPRATQVHLSKTRACEDRKSKQLHWHLHFWGPLTGPLPSFLTSGRVACINKPPGFPFFNGFSDSAISIPFFRVLNFQPPCCKMLGLPIS